MDLNAIRTRTTLITHEPVRMEAQPRVLRALFAAAEQRAESLREALGQTAAGAAPKGTKSRKGGIGG